MEDQNKVRIVSLGGMGEIGKNMTAIEYADQILIIDCGLMFPDADMLGVDIVIPDVSYLVENADRVQGIVLTHGHEDHIGALPYILPQLNVPIWGTKLTLGLVKGKLDEHKLTEQTTMNEVCPGDCFKVGDFEVEAIRAIHSIPDGIALAIRLPIGTIVHSGDFKFDHTPVHGGPVDYGKLAKLGDEGVMLLLCDSTNVEKPGHVPSERIVGDMFKQVFSKADGKIIVAMFASNIHRMQQVFDTAEHFDRKVAIAGRSMVQNIEIARQLGFLKVKDDMIIRLEDISSRYPCEVVVMTTGSQGEPLSALTRIAVDEHKKVKVVAGDTVIISATPIPGNEDLVSRTINRLFKRGANVIYDAVAPVHVSGHANREELKMMLSFIRPKYVIPVHGEQRHIARFTELAVEMGIPQERVFSMCVGDALEMDSDSAQLGEKVTAGDVLVDGIGVGDVGDVVLRDRRHLANDGIVMAVIGIDRSTGAMVAGPDIVSRGFIYVDENEELIEEAKQVVQETIDSLSAEENIEWSAAKTDIRSKLGKFLYTKTRRRPMVVPVIMEI